MAEKKEKKKEKREEPAQTETPKENQIERESRQLRNILIGIGAIALVFIIAEVWFNLSVNFKYEGVRFEITKDEGGLIFYKTAFPVYSSNGTHVADYNFYLRKDPRKLKEIPWNGSYILMKDVIVNMTKEFNCDGDGIIAIANFVNVHKFFGAEIMKDENASCDSTGAYSFISIEEGNETRIEQFGPSCYRIYIKDCEILEGTERFILETFTAAKENMKN